MKGDANNIWLIIDVLIIISNAYVYQVMVLNTLKMYILSIILP